MQARLVVFAGNARAVEVAVRCLTDAGYALSEIAVPPEVGSDPDAPDSIPACFELRLGSDGEGRRAARLLRTALQAPVSYLPPGPAGPALLLVHPADETPDLAAVFHDSGEAVITTDAQGVVTFMSPAARHLTGWSPEAAVGLPVAQILRLIASESGDAPVDLLAEVRRQGSDVRLSPQAIAITQSGSRVAVQGTAAPIRTEGGELRGVLFVLRDATEQRQAEDAMSESAERYRTLVELSPDAIVVHGGGRVLFANSAALTLFRAHRPEELVGRPVLDFVHPECHEVVKARIHDMMTTGSRVPSMVEKFLAADGDVLDVEVTAAAIRLGKSPAIMVIVRDVKARQVAQDALRESEERLRLIAENMLDIITQTDAGGIITFQTPSVRAVLGHDAHELLSTHFLALCHPDDQPHVEAKFRESLVSGTPATMEYRCRHADGSYSWLETIGNPIVDGQGTTVGAMLSSRDITARRNVEERLKFLSLHDHLTGLYNRTYFEQEMQRLDGGRSASVGTIICDVDGLKFANDTLGHEQGDALLVAVAEVLRRSFRSGDVIARIGGDEFGVLLPGTSRGDLAGAVRRIRAAIQAHNAGTPDLPVSVSIGSAVSRDRKTPMAELVRVADNNMYREKLRSGRSTRNAIINVIFRALKARDVRTDEHSERLQELVTAMAQSLSLSDETVSDLRLLARFHDIGKVGISERILSKPGPLTEEELEEMRRHSEIGHRIAQAAPELTSIAEWILRHHEWWNGRGYPGGLTGSEIPLESRILAIVDAFDAMTCDRPYRKAMTPQAAAQELERCSGTQFDPELVDRFLQMVATATR